MSHSCRNCGASLKDDVLKCKYCGASLPIKDSNKKYDEKVTQIIDEENKPISNLEINSIECDAANKTQKSVLLENKKELITLKCQCLRCRSVFTFDNTDALSSYSWDGISYWVMSCPVCGEILDVDENNKIRETSSKSQKEGFLFAGIEFLFKSLKEFLGASLQIISFIVIITCVIAIVVPFFEKNRKSVESTDRAPNGYEEKNNFNSKENNKKVSLRFCNEIVDDIKIAMLDWDDFNEDWYTSGWSEVKSNTCSIIRNSRSDKGVYWYAKNSSITNRLVWEGDVKSCVSEDSFKNKHKNYEPCVSGQTEVGFKYIDLSNTTDTFEQKLILEKSFIEKDYIEIPEKKDKENYVNPSEITDGYPFGSKIHMNGGNNYQKSYHGFILNIKPHKEDLLVLNGQYDDVLEIYLEQADAGDINAMHNLGLMYIKGLGVNKDLQKGIEYLEKSAENRKWDADSVPLEKARKQLRNSESLQ